MEKYSKEDGWQDGALGECVDELDKLVLDLDGAPREDNIIVKLVNDGEETRKRSIELESQMVSMGIDCVGNILTMALVFHVVRESRRWLLRSECVAGAK